MKANYTIIDEKQLYDIDDPFNQMSIGIYSKYFPRRSKPKGIYADMDYFAENILNIDDPLGKLGKSAFYIYGHIMCGMTSSTKSANN